MEFHLLNHYRSSLEELIYTNLNSIIHQSIDPFFYIICANIICEDLRKFKDDISLSVYLVRDYIFNLKEKNETIIGFYLKDVERRLFNNMPELRAIFLLLLNHQLQSQKITYNDIMNNRFHITEEEKNRVIRN